jgi:hypothetical protein
MYMALGYSGQFIFVEPEKELVVVFTSHLDEQDFYVPQLILNEFIIPSVISNNALPANPNGMDLLESRIEALAEP